MLTFSPRRNPNRQPARTARRIGAAVIVIAILAVTASCARHPATVSLPQFTDETAIVDQLDDTLPFNPTNEFIFPSVFHAGAHFANPLGEWYLYYGPHDAPGGIALMYADSLDGPWTQYDKSPVISNEWTGHYSVSHVASPDTVWNETEETMFLYFHGENTETRFATSDDGITFEYGDTIIDTDDVTAAQPGRTATEVSYARVFANPDENSHYGWAMFFMANYDDDIRRIDKAYSTDGRTWEVQPDVIVNPGKAEGQNVSGADLLRWEGDDYVVYGSSSGTIFARAINEGLSSTGVPVSIYVPSDSPPESGRAAAPEIVSDGLDTHLFFEMGQRSHTTIGHATATG